MINKLHILAVECPVCGKVRKIATRNHPDKYSYYCFICGFPKQKNQKTITLKKLNYQVLN